ncbi:MAG: pyridoxamine 5'-phosphate oxidase family protein [Methylococcales bacterium]|nr:pyridoxamine 5'-phosphate oxidase family protein [Methylococcales bacterium]
MNTFSLYHSGELKVQQLAKESDIAQRNASIISNKILPGAIPFIRQQNMLLISSIDNQGQVWISILIGNPGFINAINNTSLLLDTSNIINNPDDPLWKNILTNPKVGILAIELSTRRRFRVNGRIQKTNNTLFTITVEQAYPNCPKFIQRRQLKFPETLIKQSSLKISKGYSLSSVQIELINKTDSFFVGTASCIEKNAHTNDHYSCDASHRGGHPGFVEIIDGERLRIPDYHGNSMFNTLGNIQSYPKAGLVFIDFEQGKLLQVTGNATIFWNQKDPTNKTGGSQRFWELEINAWQQTQLPTELSWEFFDFSSHNPSQTENKQQPISALNLKVAQVTQKSEHIKQYRLVASKGGILPTFAPGAHLPITLSLADGKKTERCYSLLSSHHQNKYYEIAVQREDNGRGGSKYIHQHLTENSLIIAKPPRHDFSLSPIGNHTILIAGGIGITPILSMLRALVEKKSSFEIHYTAKTETDLAFRDEVLNLAGEKAQLYFSQGKNAKRLNLKYLLSKRDRNSHIFICGPARMIEAVRYLGNELNWQADHIHFESFASFQETHNSAFRVDLKKSSKIIQVQSTQTLLDALLNSNVSVPFDCKRGECGLCTTTIIKGEVDHRDIYLNNQEREQQMCVCVSRAKGKKLTLDL